MVKYLRILFVVALATSALTMTLTSDASAGHHRIENPKVMHRR